MLQALPFYHVEVSHGGDERVAPVAHLPLVLGVPRKLDVAALVDAIIAPHREQVVSAYKVGRRLDERGMLPLLQTGLEPQSLHDTCLGQTLRPSLTPLRVDY